MKKKAKRAKNDLSFACIHSGPDSGALKLDQIVSDMKRIEGSGWAATDWRGMHYKKLADLYFGMELGGKTADAALRYLILWQRKSDSVLSDYYEIGEDLYELVPPKFRKKFVVPEPVDYRPVPGDPGLAAIAGDFVCEDSWRYWGISFCGDCMVASDKTKLIFLPEKTSMTGMYSLYNGTPQSNQLNEVIGWRDAVGHISERSLAKIYRLDSENLDRIMTSSALFGRNLDTTILIETVAEFELLVTTRTLMQSATAMMLAGFSDLDLLLYGSDSQESARFFLVPAEEEPGKLECPFILFLSSAVRPDERASVRLISEDARAAKKRGSNARC